MNRINKERGCVRKYTVFEGGLLMGPKTRFPFHGDEVLKMCCFVAHFRLYFQNKTDWERCLFTREGSEEEISLRKEGIGMLLISSHIKKGGCVSFIRAYVLELLLKSDCNTPLTYLKIYTNR
jgi:hypothetical protein